MVVDAMGHSRTVLVGRVKIESRPLLLVEVDVDGQRHSVLLQNAETVCLVAPGGERLDIKWLKIELLHIMWGFWLLSLFKWQEKSLITGFYASLQRTRLPKRFPSRAWKWETNFCWVCKKEHVTLVSRFKSFWWRSSQSFAPSDLRELVFVSWSIRVIQHSSIMLLNDGQQICDRQRWISFRSPCISVQCFPSYLPSSS